MFQMWWCINQAQIGHVGLAWICLCNFKLLSLSLQSTIELHGVRAIAVHGRYKSFLSSDDHGKPASFSYL